MSLANAPIPCIPEATVRIAKAAFPHGNLCLQFRDVLGTIYYDLMHSSIVPCNAERLADLRGEARSQNRVEENLKPWNWFLPVTHRRRQIRW